MKYKKVIVTGGAGFIGSHLTERLLDEGCKVTVIDDLSEGKWENLPKNHPHLKKIKASILDDISEHFNGIDVIFHLAAIPRLQRSVAEPWKTHLANVDGTLKLLLTARDHKVKRFIFSSSSSVYGNNKTPFKEIMTPDSLVPYSLHKEIGEKYCLMFSTLWGLPTVCLRYFNVYGPGMNPDSPYANLIPKFIKLMRQGKRPIVYGDGKHSRDFTYVNDVVEANILAADSNISGEIFNIGYGKNISVNTVVKTINSLLKRDIKPKYGPSVIEPKVTLASNFKAKKMLGWSPKVGFNEGIKTMIR